LATQLGVDKTQLEPREYVLKTSGNCLLLAGYDVKVPEVEGLPINDTAATLAAVSRWLDRELGVRWLWPGELGTHVPKRTTITVGALNERVKPDLLQAFFMIPTRTKFQENFPGNRLSDKVRASVEDETMRWLGAHQLGGKLPLKFGHSFTKWWDQYHDEHPDYFAVPPAGVKQGPPDRVKLCTSNPGVVEQIVAEFKEAGAPDSWNICPNDGIFFCTCPACLAKDEGGPHSLQAVWEGDVDLSRRNILFSNEVLRRLKAINPRVMVSTYAYSSYKHVPRGLPVEPGLAIDFCGSFSAESRELWSEWSDAGVKIGLRPNWLWAVPAAPFMPLHQMSDYMKFTRANGMLGFRQDSLMGNWATQGPVYYLIARSAARPELTADDIINEWCSAFGPAAPAIKDYLNYWEKFTVETDFEIPSGGSSELRPDSPYQKAARERGITYPDLVKSWLMLPVIYTDEVFEKGEAFLTEADRVVGLGDPIITARIQFLRDGLKHARLTKEVIALAYAPQPDQEKLARRKAELVALRNDLSPRHVVRGDISSGNMLQKGIKPFGNRPLDPNAFKGM
jgi:hypothetical protein